MPKDMQLHDLGSTSISLEDRLSSLNGLLQADMQAAKELADYQTELQIEGYKKALEFRKDATKKIVAEMGQTEIKEAQFIEQAKAKAQAKLIKKKLKQKKGKKLTPEEIKAIEDQVNKEYKIGTEARAKLDKKAAKAAKRQIETGQGMADFKKNGLASVFNKNSDFNKLTGGQKLDGLAHALGDFAKQLETTIDNIAGKKGVIDTRLQGSKRKTRMGSYWEALTNTATGVAGVSPFIKQESYVNNIQSMVEKGIAFNVDQRAFLATISEKIATTFNAADGTLLRLIRIQQQDTTAGRLGMESALTSFLNNMYETTEYMTDAAASVRSSLEEMSALSGAAMATEVEYQMQKWMGSLYSVGMSQSSVNAISQAFGQLASGDIAGLNGGAGNLLVMAANAAGISIADILNQGLDAGNTNALMQAMVNYMGVIGNQSANSRVVQQQLANVYGIKASDLKAAGNLAKSTGSISKANMSYGNMMSQLNSMAGSMYKRTSIGEMMSNMWANTQYSMANGIASNPAMYAIYKAAGLLDSVAGGISIPDIMAMGSGVSLNTTVADMMRVGALSGGILSSIGQMIAAGGGGGLSGAGMLKAVGIGNGLSTVERGSGGGLLHTGGATISSSGYVGNSAGGDVLNATTTEASDNAKSLTAQAKEEEEPDIKNRVINESVLQIAEMLQQVMDGTASFTVKQTFDSVYPFPPTQGD